MATVLEARVGLGIEATKAICIGHLYVSHFIENGLVLLLFLSNSGFNIFDRLLMLPNSRNDLLDSGALTFDSPTKKLVLVVDVTAKGGRVVEGEPAATVEAVSDQCMSL